MQVASRYFTSVTMALRLSLYSLWLIPFLEGEGVRLVRVRFIFSFFIRYIVVVLFLRLHLVVHATFLLLLSSTSGVVLLSVLIPAVVILKLDLGYDLLLLLLL